MEPSEPSSYQTTQHRTPGRHVDDPAHVSDDGGFGQFLIMIAVMVAFQAELIWRRARALGARTSSRGLAAARL